MTTRTGPPFVRSSEAKRAHRQFLESFSRPIAFRLDVKEAVARLQNSAHIARRTNRRCTTLVVRSTDACVGSEALRVIIFEGSADAWPYAIKPGTSRRDAPQLWRRPVIVRLRYPCGS
jgi:hypothetical protein